jgi:hypothetical protein
LPSSGHSGPACGRPGHVAIDLHAFLTAAPLLEEELAGQTCFDKERARAGSPARGEPRLDSVVKALSLSAFKLVNDRSGGPAIQGSLEMAGKTVIAIAHRLSTSHACTGCSYSTAVAVETHA